MKFKFIFFLILLSQCGFAQNIPVPPEPLEVDSLLSQHSVDDASLSDSAFTSNNEIYPKNFAEKFRSKYRTADFDYTTTKPRESLWQKLEKRIIKMLEAVLGKLDPIKSATYATYILRFFAIVIGALVLYFFIRFLLNKNGNFFFAKKNRKLNIDEQDAHDNIHELNFPEIIRNFEVKKDFRSAIRYRFLFVLKQMTDRNLVRWTPEKTNKDYLFELKSSDSKRSFKELIYIFDYVWYGEFEVSENHYEYFKQKFLAFK